MVKGTCVDVATGRRQILMQRTSTFYPLYSATLWTNKQCINFGVAV